MRLLHRTVVLGALLVPLVVGVVPLPAATAPSVRPVAPSLREIPLAGQPHGVSAGREPHSPGTEVVSEAVPTEGFVVAGATWERGSVAPGAGLDVRTRIGESWSPWQAVPVDADHAPDGDEAAGARDGSDPIVLGEVDALQMRLRAAGGRGPRDGRMVLVDARRSPHDAVAGTSPAGAAHAATARPTVLTRAEWGADERLRTGGVEFGEVGAGFVHHTVNSNSYSAADVPAIIRGIYAFHVNGRGWKDIGYNFLVDRFGRIWEGRFGGVDRPVVGAHTAGYNDDAFAMSAIGDFTSVGPSDAMLDAYGRLFAWKLSLHGVDPGSTVRLDGTTFRAVSGHRDAASTACPGQRLYDRLSRIRTLASSYQASFGSRDLRRVLTPNAAPDLVGLTGKGAVEVAQGDGGRGFLASSRAGVGWTGFTVVGPGDWDGDGAGDVLAVERSTGILWLYPGDGRGGWRLPRRSVGSGWQAIRLVVRAGDANRDGRPDLYAVDTAGRLLLYSGDGRGGFLPTAVVGSGWQTMDLIVSPGDFTGDGIPDLLARHSTGALLLYAGRGDGGVATGRQIGSGWQVHRLVVGPGDWNGDGRVDLLGFRRDGAAVLYRGTGTGAFAGADTVGGGWQSFDAVVGVGDWNGDGTGDLLARAASTGTLDLYPGSGGRELSAPAGIGSAFPGAESVMLTADWSGDGRSDLLVRHPDGRLLLAPGRGDGTVESARTIGTGWQVLGPVAPVGDWDGDGAADLLAVRKSDGALLLYRSDGRGGFRATHVLGSNVGRFDLLVGAGRWDGDGAPDLLARDAATGDLHLLPGNGPGGVRAGRVVGRGWQTMRAVVGVGDPNGDGAPDLAALTRDGRLVLYEGDGTGAFSGATDLGTRWSGWVTAG